MKYVLDTNIITAILKKNEKVQKRAINAILAGESIFINAISYYEIKRGLLAANATKQLIQFELLCKEFDIILLDTVLIFDRAAEIYSILKQNGKLIKDADILIASVVSSRNYILVSDDSHFNRIQGLKTDNWLN